MAFVNQIKGFYEFIYYHENYDTDISHKRGS